MYVGGRRDEIKEMPIYQEGNVENSYHFIERYYIRD